MRWVSGGGVEEEANSERGNSTEGEGKGDMERVQVEGNGQY